MNWSGRRSSSGPRRRRSCSCCSANKSGCSNAASSPRAAAARPWRSLAASCATFSFLSMSDCTAPRPAFASATAAAIRGGVPPTGASGPASISTRARCARAEPRFSRSSATTFSSAGNGICVRATISCISSRDISPLASMAVPMASRASLSRRSGSNPAIPSGAGNAPSARWSVICSGVSPSICRGASPCGPALRLFVKASTRNWIEAPAPPPYSADSPVPSMIARSGLYPRSARFCTISAVTSCAASPPPVIAAFWIRCPIVSTVSGPRSLMNCPITGTSTERMKRPRGATSNRPTGAARRIAWLRCSSVAPAARARSLDSPAAAPTPRRAPIPVPTAAAGIAAGAAAAAPAIGAAKPAIEPNVWPILNAMSSLSPLRTLGFMASATD